LVYRQLEAPFAATVELTPRGCENSGEYFGRHLTSIDYLRFGRILAMSFVDAFRVPLLAVTATEQLRLKVSIFFPV
jgi:hypothetical protein